MFEVLRGFYCLITINYFRKSVNEVCKYSPFFVRTIYLILYSVEFPMMLTALIITGMLSGMMNADSPNLNGNNVYIESRRDADRIIAL
jgi:hypothetical protein